MSEFLRRAHPELAQALDHLPVLPSGPIVDVVATANGIVPGNGSAIRWAWILMVDAPEPCVLVEAVQHTTGVSGLPVIRQAHGFAPSIVLASLTLLCDGSLRPGQSATCTGRPSFDLRPKRWGYRHDSNDGEHAYWRVDRVNVGGLTRQRWLLNGDGNLRCGTLLRGQVISMHVTRLPSAPWPAQPRITITGQRKLWPTHQVFEGTDLEVVLSKARPELQKILRAQL